MLLVNGVVFKEQRRAKTQTKDRKRWMVSYVKDDKERVNHLYVTRKYKLAMRRPRKRPTRHSLGPSHGNKRIANLTNRASASRSTSWKYESGPIQHTDHNVDVLLGVCCSDPETMTQRSAKRSTRAGVKQVRLQHNNA
jgi:hypothetical protein